MTSPNLDSLPIAELISLRGRVAVVTGGAKGIGVGVARRLAEAGASILVADVDDEAGPEAARRLAEAGASILVADVDDEAGPEAARELATYGVGSAYRKVDVRNPDEVEAAADAAVQELGGLHIWANIAGIYPVKLDDFQVTPDLDDATWNRMIGINLTGTFNGARAAAKRMIAAGKGGVIINIQSTTTQKVPAPGFSPYVASKGGIEALTKSLAVELGGHGIRVLSISPTMVATPGMMAQKPVLTEAFGNIGDPHLLYGSRLPLGRIATEDEIGRVALFLASDLAAIMTGSVVAADAGDLAI